MEISGVDTVFVKVIDLDVATDWYSDILGIRPGPRYGDWQVLDVGGPVTFGLHRFDAVPDAVNAVVALKVGDLDEAIRTLSESGVESIDGEVTDTGYKRFATFADPDGNHIQLIETKSPD